VLPVVVAILAAAPTRDAGPPPRGLACLTNWYAGEVVLAGAGWGFAIDGGTVLPWRAGTRSPVSLPDGGDDEEGEEVVDLESIYRVPYVAGPIVTLDATDAGAIDDPGRVRIEQLFLTTYGQSRLEVFDHLGKVRFFGKRSHSPSPLPDRAREATPKLLGPPVGHRQGECFSPCWAERMETLQLR
jgi:hypothetical protein